MQTPLQYSTLPLQVEPSTTHTPPELILLAEHLDDSPVTANDICEWTKKTFSSIAIHLSGVAKSLQCRLGAIFCEENGAVCV